MTIERKNWYQFPHSLLFTYNIFKSLLKLYFTFHVLSHRAAFYLRTPKNLNVINVKNVKNKTQKITEQSHLITQQSHLLCTSFFSDVFSSNIDFGIRLFNFFPTFIPFVESLFTFIVPFYI